MNHATPWDHLFVLVVFVIVPIYSWRTFPAFVGRVAREGEPAKLSGYRETIAIWATSAVVLCGIWLGLERSWFDLGFRSSSPLRLVAGVALGSALIWLVMRQLSNLKTTSRDELTSQVGDVLALMPQTAREQFWFRIVSGNAGISEELIFRAFLIWYLEPIVGIYAAAVLSVVVFTLGHAYQGMASLPGIGLVSLVFVVLYLVSGSIFLPIVFHALLDIMQGRAVVRLFAKS